MNELLNKLAKRIKSKNGMVVNANVWKEAHDYHRFHQQAHFLLSHGPGIVAGLEVKADVNSRRAWIKPGLAVSPAGQLIILDEQDSAEIESTQAGLTYLFLIGAGESDFRDGRPASAKGPGYVRDGYVVESALTLPDTAVEVARIRLSGPETGLKEAQNPEQPGFDEVDLRFRQEVGARAQTMASLGISYLGEATGSSLPKYGRRAGQLARALSRLTNYRVWIDDDISLAADLQPYTVIYLVEQGPHELGWTEIEALKTHLQKGGTLLVESYQVEGGKSDMLEWLGSFVELAEQCPDDLLVEPCLFNAPPPGFELNNSLLRVGEGVIFSSRNYGRLWQREAGNDLAKSREAIRAAVEWGANIVTYAVKRRHKLE